MRANYAGNVTLIDEQIGNILEVVRRRGELERTLIVFTSDHGEMNGDQGLVYKANFLDPVVQVPLIVRPPNLDAANGSRELSVIAEWMDVGATLADYAGGSLAGLSHAKSLRPLIEGRATAHREFAVSEFLGDTAIVDERFKIEFGPDDRPALLFDRAGDPLEQVNLADDGRYAGTLAALGERLIAFRAATPAPAVKATGTWMVEDGNLSVAMVLPRRSSIVLIVLSDRVMPHIETPPTILAMFLILPPSRVALTDMPGLVTPIWPRPDNRIGTGSAMPPAVETSASRPCLANSPLSAAT